MKGYKPGITKKDIAEHKQNIANYHAGKSSENEFEAKTNALGKKREISKKIVVDEGARKAFRAAGFYAGGK